MTSSSGSGKGGAHMALLRCFWAYAFSSLVQQKWNLWSNCVTVVVVVLHILMLPLRWSHWRPHVALHSDLELTSWLLWWVDLAGKHNTDDCCCEDAPLCQKGLTNTGASFIPISILLFLWPAYFFPTSLDFILVPYASGCLSEQTPHAMESTAPQLGQDWNRLLDELLKTLPLI